MGGDVPGLTSIAAAALRSISQFDWQDLACTVWSMAALAFSTFPLRHAIASSSRRLLSEASAGALGQAADAAWTQGLANTAWSYARLECCHVPLLDAISSSSIPTLHAADSQHISNTVCAVARLGFYDSPLFAAIAAPSLRKISG